MKEVGGVLSKGRAAQGCPVRAQRLAPNKYVVWLRCFEVQ